MSYKSYMMDHYRGLENGDTTSANPAMFRRTGGFKGVPGKLNYSHIYDYKKGDSRNYMKDKIIQQVGVFAQALADTAGSAFAAFDSSGAIEVPGKPAKRHWGPQLQAGSLATQPGSYGGRPRGPGASPKPCRPDRPDGHASGFNQLLADTRTEPIRRGVRVRP